MNFLKRRIYRLQLICLAFKNNIYSTAFASFLLTLIWKSITLPKQIDWDLLLRFAETIFSVFVSPPNKIKNNPVRTIIMRQEIVSTSFKLSGTVAVIYTKKCRNLNLNFTSLNCVPNRPLRWTQAPEHFQRGRKNLTSEQYRVQRENDSDDFSWEGTRARCENNLSDDSLWTWWNSWVVPKWVMKQKNLIDH